MTRPPDTAPPDTAPPDNGMSDTAQPAFALVDARTRDRVEAGAFRRLLAHLRLRDDIANIDLMGHAGFCRNCLSDWLAEAAAEAGIRLDREAARLYVYGEPYAAWKARQREATPEQLARMAATEAETRRRNQR
ncbi:DUF1244 domain-containing protein [Thermaurantiacus sp.]